MKASNTAASISTVNSGASGLSIAITLHKNGALIAVKIGKAEKYYHKETLREASQSITNYLTELWGIKHRG